MHELFARPRHRYTQGLLRSVPSFTAVAERAKAEDKDGDGDDDSVPVRRARKRLQEIPGMVPSLLELPAGCKFQGRCQYVQQDCKDKEPQLTGGADHEFRCFHPVEDVAQEATA